ncbi:MAG: glycosyltransferase family 4 protein [Saprospiraceae bacterium]|nr:glycosyltransferase family 4 protein [Candidatus Opimibacter iunctus]
MWIHGSNRGLQTQPFEVFWLTLPVARVKYLTAISEATKMDILKYTGCQADSITVIPVAVDEIYRPVPKRFDTECPRILQIGTAPNKNLERLIQAIKGIECTLVVIGKLTETQTTLLAESEIKLINRMNLTQEELYDEYRKADIVTFISTFEGFGMPIIEANCVERPVIAGNNSSMPEVGGDAALYVDAYSVDDIRSGLTRIINDEELRNKLIQKGRSNKERFSNETIANMYGALYDRVLSNLN